MNLIRLDEKRVIQFEDLLQRFEEHLYLDGKSNHTVKSYLTSVKKYDSWFQKKYGNPSSKLFRENIIEYKEMMEQQDMNPKTYNLRLTGLGAFNDFLIKQGIQQSKEIKKQDYKKIQANVANPCKFEKSEILRFVQTVLESGNKRDYTLVNFLCYTGCRISEALSIKLTCLNIQSREVVILKGKGNKSRTILISEKLARILQEYMKNVRPNYKLADSSEYLFLSNKHEQLSRMTVNKAFHKYSEEAGLNPLSPHDLRHFFCTNALENGFDVHEVAAIAGHSSLNTTLLYTNPSRRKMLDKLNQL